MSNPTVKYSGVAIVGYFGGYFERPLATGSWRDLLFIAGFVVVYTVVCIITEVFARAAEVKP